MSSPLHYIYIDTRIVDTLNLVSGFGVEMVENKKVDMGGVKMVKSSRVKEDQLLVQINALIGHLEDKRVRVERSEAGPVEVAELTVKVDEVWEVLCRRQAKRGLK